MNRLVEFTRKYLLFGLLIVAVYTLFFLPLSHQYLFYGSIPENLDFDGFRVLLLFFTGTVTLSFLPGWICYILFIPISLMSVYAIQTTLLNNFDLIFFTSLGLVSLIQFQRKPKCWKAQLLVFSLFFLVIEFGFLVAENARNNEWKYIHSGPSWGQDSIVRTRPLPDNKYEETKYVGDTLIYDSIEYATDQKGRRRCNSNRTDSPYHAIFLGCSFMWGDGVATDETITCAFQELSDGQFQTYNYSIPGTGPGEMLLQLRHPELFEDIQQKQGICVYGIIWDHLRRNTYNPHRAFNGSKQHICFKLDDSQNLVGPFQFTEDQKLHHFSRILEFNYRISPFLRYVIDRTIPSPYSQEEQLAVVLMMIREMRERYTSMFDGEFYVMLWPYQKTPEFWSSLRIQLENDGIPFITIPSRKDQLQYQHHKYDCHPNEMGHSWAANNLWQSLSRINQSPIAEIRDKPSP